jgi:hypothetical protein
MPNLSATTLRSSIRQSRGLRRILAMSFAAFDAGIWYHMRYHRAMVYTTDKQQRFLHISDLTNNHIW